MFRRVERQVESNDCLSLFLNIARETLTFCPPIIEKKFPLKGGFVRQKHLGKMITIDFFDAQMHFVVRHTIEPNKPRNYPFLLAKVYIRAIFYWYESACYAVITTNGITQMVRRYE